MQRLLITIPKQMHWNAFRFCIGPVPDRWLQIADENGTAHPERILRLDRPSQLERRHQAHYDAKEMTTEYTEWMRDNWNHPSVAIWDATNESWLPNSPPSSQPCADSTFPTAPWENSYNGPPAPTTRSKTTNTSSTAWPWKTSGQRQDALHSN